MKITAEDIPVEIWSNILTETQPNITSLVSKRFSSLCSGDFYYKQAYEYHFGHLFPKDLVEKAHGGKTWSEIFRHRYLKTLKEIQALKTKCLFNGLLYEALLFNNVEYVKSLLNQELEGSKIINLIMQDFLKNPTPNCSDFLLLAKKLNLQSLLDYLHEELNNILPSVGSSSIDIDKIRLAIQIYTQQQDFELLESLVDKKKDNKYHLQMLIEQTYADSLKANNLFFMKKLFEFSNPYIQKTLSKCSGYELIYTSYDAKMLELLSKHKPLSWFKKYLSVTIRDRATMDEKYDIVKFALTHVGLPNVNSLINMSIHFGHLEMLELLIQHCPFYVAEPIRQLESWLEYGAMHALHISVIDYLIKRGATIDSVITDTNSKFVGMSFYEVAMHFGNHKIADYILEKIYSLQDERLMLDQDVNHLNTP